MPNRKRLRTRRQQQRTRQPSAKPTRHETPAKNMPTPHGAQPTAQVLNLQRTIGNQRVGRLMGNTVQRFDLKRDTFTPKHSITRLALLRGGKQGKVFKFRVNDKARTELVAKYDAAGMEESLLGSKIQEMAGSATPYMRKARPGERAAMVGANKLRLSDDGSNDLYFMAFAEGANMANALSKRSAVDLERLLLNPGFWASIGRMHAADLMSGNYDRFKFMQDKLGTNIRLSNTSNLANIMVNFETLSATAIDNAMLRDITAVHDLRGFKSGKLADIRREMTAIVDFIAKQVEKRDGDKKSGGEFKAVATKLRSNAAVLKAAERAAHLTFTKLLAKNAGWKAKLGTKAMQDAGIGGDDYQRFKRRQRFVRMLRGGLDAKTAAANVRDVAKYKAWRTKDRTTRLARVWPGLDKSVAIKYANMPSLRYRRVLRLLGALHARTGGTRPQLGLPAKLIAQNINVLTIWGNYRANKINAEEAMALIMQQTRKRPAALRTAGRKKKRSLFGWLKKKKQ